MAAGLQAYFFTGNAKFLRVDTIICIYRSWFAVDPPPSNLLSLCIDLPSHLSNTSRKPVSSSMKGFPDLTNLPVVWLM